MANYKYFADLADKTIEFKQVDYRKDGAYGYDAESRQWVKISRKVIFRPNPSRHECDSRCMTATGKTMQCECACGGKNHGKAA